MHGVTIKIKIENKKKSFDIVPEFKKPGNSQMNTIIISSISME